MLHRAVGIDGAAARCNHRIPRFKRRQYFCLVAEERRVALGADDLLQFFAAVLLQDQIGIAEMHAEQFCQHHADCALAAAGHTNQNNVHQFSPVLARYSIGEIPVCFLNVLEK